MSGDSLNTFRRMHGERTEAIRQQQAREAEEEAQLNSEFVSCNVEHQRTLKLIEQYLNDAAKQAPEMLRLFSYQERPREILLLEYSSQAFVDGRSEFLEHYGLYAEQRHSRITLIESVEIKTESLTYIVESRIPVGEGREIAPVNDTKANWQLLRSFQLRYMEEVSKDLTNHENLTRIILYRLEERSSMWES